MQASAQEAEQEVLQLMSKSLPSYVTKCFMAVSFDTVDVIMNMDVSDELGNSTDKIEQFVAAE